MMRVFRKPDAGAYGAQVKKTPAHEAPELSEYLTD